MCMMVTPERNVPSGVIGDIRESYKEIQNRLTETKAIEQLLQGKYRQYYHRDTLRDKEIMEIGFIAKNCYSKFKYTLLQRQAQEKMKSLEKEPPSRVEKRGIAFQWFHNKENQVIFIRSLRILKELNYESPTEQVREERRGIVQHLRSITLFVFSGDVESIEDLQSRIQLREHNIIERYARDELHGLLPHLREIDSFNVEKIFKGFMERGGFSKLKCLLFSIHSHKDLEEEILGLVKPTLEKMTEGEVKTLSI